MTVMVWRRKKKEDNLFRAYVNGVFYYSIAVEIENAEIMYIIKLRWGHKHIAEIPRRGTSAARVIRKAKALILRWYTTGNFKP